MTTTFPFQPRRDDPNGHMKVFQLLQIVRDALDSFIAGMISGSTTITVGNTSAIASHMLNRSLYSAVVVPQRDPGGSFWVSNKTNTQFQINLGVAAPVGGVAFDWFVKGA